MRTYLLQTIYRRTRNDPPIVGPFSWPFPARSDVDATRRADRLLTIWENSEFAALRETGDAVRIVSESDEVAWKSLDRETGLAEWT